MRKVSAAILLVLAAIATHPQVAYAGAFTDFITCDSLSTSPVRLLDGLWIGDYRGLLEFCSVRYVAVSYQGSPVIPAVGCDAPPGFHCQVDSLSGTATFYPDTCITTHYWEFNQGFGIVVGASGAIYEATLFGTGGQIEKVQLISAPGVCDAPTAVMPATWGRIKASYR